MSQPEVHVWCREHTDKARVGYWVVNETPMKCQECERQAEWVLVEEEHEQVG